MIGNYPLRDNQKGHVPHWPSHEVKPGEYLEAIKKEQTNLTPMYIDYIRASNWDGKLPSTVLGSNSNVMVPLR